MLDMYMSTGIDEASMLHTLRGDNEVSDFHLRKLNSSIVYRAIAVGFVGKQSGIVQDLQGLTPRVYDEI